MLISLFFSDRVGRDDDFIDFVYLASNNWKEVPDTIDEAINVRRKTIDWFNPVMLEIERTAWPLLKLGDLMVFSLSDGQRDSFLSIRK